ncbi:protein FAR1-RELATED SEQUENCE 7-like [Silene latifolia]|uniref:protein FAR1-RELATED SEQUENCE 7-like n=1 Tax=Silene latifolia TaxID=37657 RepID=UPI003D7731D0
MTVAGIWQLSDTIEHNEKRKPNEEEFCRDVEEKFTPYIGQEFLEIEEAVTFYKIYAVACGFDVRKYTAKRWRGGEIKSKLLLKIGATKTYKILKEHVNGFENIGASLNDFKNFHRDVKCYIHERDGQMFVDHFKEMAVNRSGFFFDYDVDSDGSLSKSIWADGIARRNYSVFGDAVSFDPTYSTNKYDMAFTPFTGVNHHKRSITFCGALVAHEDAESFQWVFSRFLAAMGGKEPKYIITDQDAGILKVKLNAIIWDEYIEAAEFDAKWEEIGREHTVNNIDWFKEMYAKRRQWVMAHCRDLEMGGVMRTTQRSQSKNSFFKIFESKSGTMLERKGILCRHVIWIYSSNGGKKIPELCVVNRWCKDAIRSKMFDGNGEAAEDVDIIDGKQITMSIMWTEIHQTVAMLMGKFKADVDNFSSLIREFKEKLSPLGSPLNKQQQLEKILGYSASHEITILPLKQSKNKGSGKRMLSLKEKAVALASKLKLMCKNCKRLANHDKRNCPNPFAEHPPLSPSSEESLEEEEEEAEEEEDDILE